MAFRAALEPKRRSPRALEDLKGCENERHLNLLKDSMAAVTAVRKPGRYSLRGGIAWSVDLPVP